MFRSLVRAGPKKAIQMAIKDNEIVARSRTF